MLSLKIKSSKVDLNITYLLLYIVTAGDIEATSYALLTFLRHGEISQTVPIVKWIIKQRNSRGGFFSTQVSEGGQEGVMIRSRWGLNWVESGMGQFGVRTR